MPVILTLPADPAADALARALAPMLADLDAVLRRGVLEARDAVPILLAMQQPGRASYLFHGLSVEDAADIAATVAAYRAAPLGWIGDARSCGRLRLCLKTRVPWD